MFIRSIRWERLLRHRIGIVSLMVSMLLVLCSFFGPLLWSQDFAATDFTALKQGPTLMHPFGTDALGRDMLARVLKGGQVSLTVAFISQFIALAIGTAVGVTGGYLAPRMDAWLMRGIDTLMAIPGILMLILLVPVLTDPFNQSIIPNWLVQANKTTGGAISLTLAMALTNWLIPARLIRGQVLAIREMEYVLAAKAYGATRSRIATHQILPNLATVIIVAATLGIPQSILQESGISFLGLGITPPLPSWGTLVAEGVEGMRSTPHIIIAPATMLILTTWSLSLLGDSLRDVFDPTTY